MGNHSTISPPLKRRLQRWLASTPRLFTFAEPDARPGPGPTSRPPASALPRPAPLTGPPAFRPFTGEHRSHGKGNADSWDRHVQGLADDQAEVAKAGARRRRVEAQLRGLGLGAGAGEGAGEEAADLPAGAQPFTPNVTSRWSLKRAYPSSKSAAPRMRRSMSSSSSTSRWSFLSISTSPPSPPQCDSSPPTSHEGPASSSSPAHDLAPLLPATPSSQPANRSKLLYRHSMDVPNISTERLRGAGRKESSAPSLSPARLATIGSSIDTTLDAEGRRVLMSKRRKSLDPTWAQGGDMREVPIISQPPVKVKMHKTRFGVGDDEDDDPPSQDGQASPSPLTPSTPSQTPPSWLVPPAISFPSPHPIWSGSSWTGSIIVSSPGALSPAAGPDVSPSADGLDTLVENHSWSTLTSPSNRRRWSAAPAMPGYESSSGYTHPRDRSEEYYASMLPPARPLYDHPLASFPFPPGPPSPSATPFNTLRSNFPLASAPPTPTAPVPTFSTPSRHVSVLRRSNKPGIARAQTLSVAPAAFSSFQSGSSSATGSPTGPPLPSPTAVTFRLPDGYDTTGIVRRVTSPTPPRAGTKVGWARPRSTGWLEIGARERGRREAGGAAEAAVEEPRGRLFVANPDALSDSDEDEPAPTTPAPTTAASTTRPQSSRPQGKRSEGGVREGAGGRLSWVVDSTRHAADYRTVELGQIGLAY